MKYDVFICHASEDKSSFVRPLAERLKQSHVEVWYDEFSLSIGDSLTEKIDEGLSQSRFGIVVLSKHFFSKPWAKRELTGLTQREIYARKQIILPIWHGIDLDDVIRFSPPLADKKAGSSKEGINTLVRDILKRIKPDESPLVVARDYLSNLDVDVPPISDEWWLNIIEYKEFLKYPDTNANQTWIFPLPYPEKDHGKNRGLNIASTALQIDWSFDAEEKEISQITHPDIVHDFIRRWPGLYDCARSHPGILALYAPQLTIRGFDEGFEDVFDELLVPENPEANRIFSYGNHDTVDGKPELCGDIIALRHPEFGNYTYAELGDWYFYAHDLSYIREQIGIFNGLVWLLSSDSAWLPERIRNVLIEGICARSRWTDIPHEIDNEFIRELWKKSRTQFRMTKTIERSLKELVTQSIAQLKINQDPNIIIQSLMDIGIIQLYYDYTEYIEKLRNDRT